jgi:hypothetical protein
LAPVVFTLTTLGDRLHLSLTYRQALLTDEAAGGLADAFLGRLAALGGAERPLTVIPNELRSEGSRGGEPFALEIPRGGAASG